MQWARLRKTYGCCKREVHLAEKKGKEGRIFYAIDGRWSNTNIISMVAHENYLYMWGSELTLGWLFQPIKLPLSELRESGSKICFFKKRQVYELTVGEMVMSYAVP